MKLKQINMTPKKRRIRGPLLTNNVQHPSSTFLRFPFWQVLFLYPDMATGLRGEWNGEKIIRPKVVELVAERCRLANVQPF